MRTRPLTTERMLLFILVLGIVGTGAELLLLEHYEDAWQVAPLALLAVGLAAVVWHAVSPGGASLAAVTVVMALFLLSGALGVYLHYGANAEFELEMYPELRGFGLFAAAMAGATPALAPGMMVLLGLIGLVYAHERTADRGDADLADEPRAGLISWDEEEKCRE